MSLINVKNLTFAYPGSYDNVFENASFQIDTDWRLGLIGRNGRGKTTLMRLLRGEFEFGGSMSAAVSFDYFPFAVESPEANTFGVVEACCPGVELWQLQKELATLETDAELLFRPFSTLSNGEQTKVLLAALFSRDHRFLLIDEPTNHLDMNSRELVSRWLSTKSGFILVSHDRAFLDGCVNHIIAINRVDIEVQRGNYSSWRENRDRLDSFELAENEKITREVRRLDATAKEQGRRASLAEGAKYTKGSKTGQVEGERGHISRLAAKSMKRAKVTERRLERTAEEKLSLLKNIEEVEGLKLRPLSYRSARLASLENLAVSYENREVFSGFDLLLERGERIALSGKNGCGKSSILKLLLGENISYNGSLYVASGLKISYVPQDTSFLRGNLTDYAVEGGIDEPLFKAILRKLGFERVQFEKDMSDFSGGQKKKVLIARSLCESAHLYIWDEPLNFIDLESRAQIEDLISAYEPAMIFVEHDRTFVETVATRIVEVGR